jgi:hypothetical protein
LLFVFSWFVLGVDVVLLWLVFLVMFLFVCACVCLCVFGLWWWFLSVDCGENGFVGKEICSRERELRVEKMKVTRIFFFLCIVFALT